MLKHWRYHSHALSHGLTVYTEVQWAQQHHRCRYLLGFPSFQAVPVSRYPSLSKWWCYVPRHSGKGNNVEHHMWFRRQYWWLSARLQYLQCVSNWYTDIPLSRTKPVISFAFLKQTILMIELLHFIPTIITHSLFQNGIWVYSWLSLSRAPLICTNNLLALTPWIPNFSDAQLQQPTWPNHEPTSHGWTAQFSPHSV